jgi:hypothetical protein
MTFYRIIKAIVLWGYARNTWQYDVLCLLILVFIFLTPQKWFENSELQYRKVHRIGASSPVLLVASNEDLSMNPDKSKIENRVRSLPGKSNATVTDIRPQTDSSGKVIAYEVDIR